jgi:hypothetical protein
MLTCLQLAILRIVNVRVVALVPRTFTGFPPLETRAGRRVRRLVFQLGLLRPNARRALTREEILADLVRAIPLKLSINHRPKTLIGPLRIVGGKPIKDGDVVPDGRVGARLVIERTEHAVLLRPYLHFHQALVPLMHEQSQIVVTHCESVK